jgi:hypothetical protein
MRLSSNLLFSTLWDQSCPMLVECRQQPYLQRWLPELAKLLSFNISQSLIPWNMLPDVRERLSSLQCLYLESDVAGHLGEVFLRLICS